MTDDKVKDFVVMNFGQYFQSMREKLYSELCEEQSLRKIGESLYIFLTTPDEVEKYVKVTQSNSSDSYVLK